jgi:hypothetical protein
MSLSLAHVSLGNTFILFLFCINVVTFPSLLRIMMNRIGINFHTQTLVQMHVQTADRADIFATGLVFFNLTSNLSQLKFQVFLNFTSHLLQ